MVLRFVVDVHTTKRKTIYNKAARRRLLNLKRYWTIQCNRILKYNIIGGSVERGIRTGWQEDRGSIPDGGKSCLSSLKPTDQLWNSPKISSVDTGVSFMHVFYGNWAKIKPPWSLAPSQGIVKITESSIYKLLDQSLAQESAIFFS
jgi:hypothetical protein